MQGQNDMREKSARSETTFTAISTRRPKDTSHQGSESGDGSSAGPDRVGLNVAAESGDTALYNAARLGHLEIVRLLLQRGAEAVLPRYGGYTPINAAANNGHTKVVELLLEEHQIDIGKPENEGRGPLYNAAYYGHYEIVRLLLDRGADATVLSNAGFAPFHVASQEGYTKIAGLIVDQTDFDINSPASNGATALYLAARNGQVETVRALIERGADTACQTKDGWTPLNAASNQGHLEVVKLLLEYDRDYILL